MNAFGAYQIIGSTMKGAKKSLGLTGNEKMTQQLQDRIYQDYLVKEKRKDMYKYLTGGNNLNAAITAAAGDVPRSDTMSEHISRNIRQH